MRVLFGICSWGLGHATRSAVLIKEFLRRGWDVTVYTARRSYEFLKNEFGKDVEVLEGVGYPLPYTKNRGFILKFSAYFPLILKAIVEEHAEIRKICRSRQFDLIVSDNKYGVYHRSVPSLFLGHQLRYLAPYRFLPLELMTELFNDLFKYKFDFFVVPDFPGKPNLSGDLSHDLRFIPNEIVRYVGIISSFTREECEEDIDYYISISGPEPARTYFERLVLTQLTSFPREKKVVVVLGVVEKRDEFSSANVKVYSFVSDKKLRNELFNRAKFVLSRSGYTTIMDVVELGKRGCFVPTPEQTEQEYLAQHLHPYFFSLPQKEFDLLLSYEGARNSRGFLPPWRTERSVEKFFEVVEEVMR